MNSGLNPPADSDGGEDRLARALAALKRTPIPEGPSGDLLARSLAAVQAADSRPINVYSWKNRMFTCFKMAAAVLAAAGAWFLVPGPLLVGAPITFEEVASRLGKAHTLAYTMTTRIGDDASPQSVRLLFKEPGRLRCEAVPAGGVVVVSDTVAARKLILDPAAKLALVLEGNLPGEVRPGQPDLAAVEVEGLRQLGRKKGEPVGEKTLGGGKVIGFRVAEGSGLEQVVWADATTRLPVQVDITGPFGDKTLHSTIRDIQLDPDLDDALFRLEPPKGYTLQKQALAPVGDKDDGSPEAAIPILLRAYAEKSGGTFPKRLDNWRALAEAFKPGPDEPAQAAAMRTANLLARAGVLLYHCKDAHGYRPEGVKLGDADKVLFWYRPPGKTVYRALSGALTFKDATQEQVPVPLKPTDRP
jgi:outer membrane lipoprotein-sorting protein